MSKVISIRFKEPQVERLQRVARRINRTQSEAAALLLDEALRTAEHAHIVFRDTAGGHHAFVAGTGLAVWEIVSLSRQFDGDVAKTAEHLEVAPLLVQAALNYAHDYPTEIAATIDDNAFYDERRISQMIPQLEVREVDIGSAPGSGS